jgi:hypothetical protein
LKELKRQETHFALLQTRDSNPMDQEVTPIYGIFQLFFKISTVCQKYPVGKKLHKYIILMRYQAALHHTSRDDRIRTGDPQSPK